MNDKPVLHDRYGSLKRVLADAMLQAKSGKGRERHADGEDFENQKICVINRWLVGSPIAGALFQAVKKAVESSRMTPAAAIRELHGAINYLSAGVILLEEMDDSEEVIDVHDATESKVNEEIRRIEQKMIAHLTKDDVQVHGLTEVARLPGGEPMYDVKDQLKDELAVFEAPLCEDCWYMLLSPRAMPCKKCIDKPFRPHFTKPLLGLVR